MSVPRQQNVPSVLSKLPESGLSGLKSKTCCPFDMLTADPLILVAGNENYHYSFSNPRCIFFHSSRKKTYRYMYIKGWTLSLHLLVHLFLFNDWVLLFRCATVHDWTFHCNDSQHLGQDWNESAGSGKCDPRRIQKDGRKEHWSDCRIACGTMFFKYEF